MTLPIVPLFIRKFFARSYNNGESVDGTMLASLDSQLADCVIQGNQNRARLNAISTSAGSLRYTLTQRSRQIATASQTAFTVSAYDNTNDIVDAWTNSASGTLLYRIDPSSVTKTSSTVVTIPAQTVGAIVVIDIRSVGNGTSQLASTSTGQGAGLVGYANTTGLGSAADVENALDEIYTDLNDSSFLSGVIGASGFIQADGSVDFSGDQSMDGNKLTDLGAGSASSNDAARMADITPAALQSALGTYLSGTYVPLSGNVTMTGPLDFGGSQTITNLPQATASGQPVTYDQINSVSGSGKNAIINGAALVAQWSDYTASISGTFDYGKADLCKGGLTGTAVSGTLTQGNNLAGAIGNSFSWTSVTTTGSGTATFSFFIEAKDAIRFKNKTASFSCKFLSDHVSTVTVSVSVYKPTVADNFATTTLIGSGVAASAPTNTLTSISYQNISMGDCSNGIVINIVAAIGAVTNKNFSIAEVQFEPGAIATAFEFEPYALTLFKVKRYIEICDPAGATNAIAVGQVTTTSTASFAIHYVQKRATPTVTVTGSNLTVTKADGTSQAISAGSSTNIGPTSCQVDMTTSAATLVAGNATVLRGGASAGGIKAYVLF